MNLRKFTAESGVYYFERGSIIITRAVARTYPFACNWVRQRNFYFTRQSKILSFLNHPT